MASISDAGQWCVLTDQRLIWSQAGEASYIDIKELKVARVNLGRILRHGIPKAQNTEIQIAAADGTTNVINVEAGPAFSGFLSILMHIAGANARGRRRPRHHQP